jgi:hypothetical protein
VSSVSLWLAADNHRDTEDTEIAQRRVKTLRLQHIRRRLRLLEFP